MAKRKEKTGEDKNKRNYKVGYCKPPKEYRWRKGCKSPNPKGRPKKPKTLKEAIQICFNKEISAKKEKGEIQKITCMEALVNKTIADAISKDGPTRRLLYREDILNMLAKDPELEFTEKEKKALKIEKEYGKLLHAWAEIDPKLREKFRKILTEQLRTIAIERIQNEK